MANWLYRIGVYSFRNRKKTVAIWVALVVGIVLLNQTIGGGEVDDFTVPGAESSDAVEVLKERFPERAGATAMVVFHTEDGSVNDPANAEAINASLAEIRAMDSVVQATEALGSPQSVSQDGTTAFTAVQFDAPTADLGSETYDELKETAELAESAGIQVEFGGELPTLLKERTTGPAEAIGILAALVILFITFRSFRAMAMPLGAAIIGLITGLSIVGLLGGLIDIPSMAPRLGTMIGLGVGIDYALFILSRHRDNLAKGMDMEESIGQTNATAGQAVVIAGGTVVIAILGLMMAGIPFVSALGYAASIVVAVAVVVAITLLPALLGFSGNKILSHKDQVKAKELASNRLATAEVVDEVVKPEVSSQTGWVRWAHWVSHHPWRSSIAASIILLVMAIPVLDMRLGQADAGTDPEDTTHRQAYDLLADGFGDGFNGPLLITVDLTDSDSPEMVAGGIRETLVASDGVAAVSPPEFNAAGDTALITVIPTTKPQDEATSDLIHLLRDETLPAITEGTGAEAYVGGPTAAFIDQSDKIADRLPWFIGAVVAVSFLLLMVVFRSILVPLKAAIMNLLAIGAAYGVVVAVFQWGWGRSLIGLEEAVPIASFLPMMMFAILFGLSMDYEVFILSRIREEYQRGHTNIDSVVEGLGATAKVITAAALIMISVFLGFVVSDDPIVKMMGVGLATAVAVDATIIRMVLVPSTMALIGDPNWWLPKWLDRLLPNLDLEGGANLGKSPVEEVVEATSATTTDAASAAASDTASEVGSSNE